VLQNEVEKRRGCDERCDQHIRLRWQREREEVLEGAWHLLIFFNVYINYIFFN
jgi:hypothetical protein